MVTNSVRPLHSIRTWFYLGCLLLVLVVVYYIVADRRTPYTSDAYLQALVIQVAPQIDGVVTAVHVSNDSVVKKGDVLFEIAAEPYQYEADRLKAQLVEAQYDIKKLESTLDAQKAIVAERKATVDFDEETYKRVKALEKDDFDTRERLDQITGTLSSDKALLHEAQAKVDALQRQLEAIVDGDHASVKQVKAQLALADWKLANTHIPAPANGIIDDVQLSVGSYAQTGTAVLSLVDTSDWWVVANFPENALSVIEPGQTVILSLPTHPGERFQGKVDSVGWGVQQGQGVPSGALPDVENPADWITLPQRFQVRIRVDPASKLDVRVGASAQVVVLTGDNGPMADIARFLMVIGSYLNYIY
jgi:multidrug resistance efflux pump